MLLISCGTARGVLYGTGTVLEGMATDARSVENWIKYHLSIFITQTFLKIFRFIVKFFLI